MLLATTSGLRRAAVGTASVVLGCGQAPLLVGCLAIAALGARDQVISHPSMGLRDILAGVGDRDGRYKQDLRVELIHSEASVSGSPCRPVLPNE